MVRLSMTFAALAGLMLAAGCDVARAGEDGGRAATRSSATAAATQVALTIRGPQSAHRFRVELAVTPAEQARGLMYRTELPADGGMLFPFDPPRIVAFWMKNTYIPLDMIFIGADRRIARIAARTTPHSLEPVESGLPVIAVLELAGGTAEARGIVVGDRVDW